MTKSITFKALDRIGFETLPKPYPAKQSIPKWFRDLSPYSPAETDPEGSRLVLENGVPNFSPKKCTPMLDSMTTGYIIPLHSDVLVRSEPGIEPELSWRSSIPVFDRHGTTANSVEHPVGYHSQAFKFLNTWLPLTPKGYSILVTQPMGFHDTPFRAIPAIIDTDKPIKELLPPIWVKDGFNGVVEKGTPLVQIIPFKRDDWKSEFDFFEPEEFKIHAQNSFFSTISNNYIRNIWSKKNFR